MRHPEKIRRKGGIVWQVRAPKPGGGQQYRTFKTKKAADAYAAAQETARSRGAEIDSTKRWEEALAEFRRAHFVSLRPSAVKDLTELLAHLSRNFAGWRLREVTPAALERFRDETLARIRGRQLGVTREGLARAERRAATLRRQRKDPTTAERKCTELRERLARVESTGGLRQVNKALTVAGTFLTFCVSRGWVASNAVAHVKRLRQPAAADRPIGGNILTPEELERLLAATAPQWRAAMGVLAYGGLRLGELLGLQWADVEFDRGRILVRRQLEAVTGELREPKTRAGTRFVELPATVMSELRRWKLACPKGELDLCFPNTSGGPTDCFNFRSRQFLPALRRAGLRRVRVHDLRHGAASMLIAAGADIAAISRQMGHANVAITLGVYSHWFARRAETGLGATLERFLAQEQNGCEMVVSPSREAQIRS